MAISNTQPPTDATIAKLKFLELSTSKDEKKQTLSAIQKIIQQNRDTPSTAHLNTQLINAHTYTIYSNGSNGADGIDQTTDGLDGTDGCKGDNGIDITLNLKIENNFITGNYTCNGTTQNLNYQSTQPFIIYIETKGGKGGDGGAGGTGLHHRPEEKSKSPKTGNPGGNGGRGGDGGNGGVVTVYVDQHSTQLFSIIKNIDISGGRGGIGGTAGEGGPGEAGRPSHNPGFSLEVSPMVGLQAYARPNIRKSPGPKGASGYRGISGTNGQNGSIEYIIQYEKENRSYKKIYELEIFPQAPLHLEPHETVSLPPLSIKNIGEMPTPEAPIDILFTSEPEVLEISYKSIQIKNLQPNETYTTPPIKITTTNFPATVVWNGLFSCLKTPLFSKNQPLQKITIKSPTITKQAFTCYKHKDDVYTSLFFRLEAKKVFEENSTEDIQRPITAIYTLKNENSQTISTEKQIIHKANKLESETPKTKYDNCSTSISFQPSNIDSKTKKLFAKVSLFIRSLNGQHDIPIGVFLDTTE
jgi:hypothetical protein